MHYSILFAQVPVSLPQFSTEKLSFKAKSAIKILLSNKGKSSLEVFLALQRKAN
jgi:hypothetical protein